MGTISAEQLLESVELDFIPKYIVKNEDGDICICSMKPEIADEYTSHWTNYGEYVVLEQLRLTEFVGKEWNDCIYQIKKKKNLIQKLGKLNVSGSNMTMNQNTVNKIVETINILVDEVNKINETDHEYPTLAKQDSIILTDSESRQITYMADGKTKVYYGRNGTEVETNNPLPVGFVITIKETTNDK